MTRAQIIGKLFSITIEWNDLEDSMGENTALEVACQKHGVTSEWYYSNYPDQAEAVSDMLEKYYDS